MERTSRRTRTPTISLEHVLLIILFSSILLTFAIAGIVLGQNKYFNEANLNDANYGDQILVSKMVNDFSTTWCGSYLVDPWDYANITLLPDLPKIDPSNLLYTVIDIDNSMMGGNVYDQRGAYLLEGSIIALNVCRELPTNVELKVLVIRGEKLWDKWFKNQYTCKDCSLINETIPLDVLCGASENGKQEVLNFTVTEEDFYRVVISRKFLVDEPKSAYLTYDIILTKRMYEIPANVTPVCIHTQDICNVELSHDSTQQILISFQETFRLGGVVRYKHTCKAYLALWISIFGVLPLSLSIVVSGIVIILIICKRRKTPEKSRLIQ